jgi:hypothetical protein
VDKWYRQNTRRERNYKAQLRITYQESQDVLVDILNYTEKPEQASKGKERRVGNEETAEEETMEERR